jgi:hypothetical protein
MKNELRSEPAEREVFKPISDEQKKRFAITDKFSALNNIAVILRKVGDERIKEIRTSTKASINTLFFGKFQ